MINKIKIKKTWGDMFSILCEFKNTNNHCRIPIKYEEDPFLGLWINRQRTKYKKGILPQEQINKLDEIGFVWNPNQGEWEKNFLELCKFKDAHLHCDVPRNYAENNSLGRWVNNQRNLYKKGYLAVDQIKKLNDIGFTWDCFDSAWEKTFTDLCKFKSVNGLLNTTKENSLWCSRQRALYKDKKLSRHKIKKLESIGFDWDPVKTCWERQFSELQKFKNEFGNCDVTRRATDKISLVNWVNRQRAEFVKEKLPQDLIKRLKDIGFVFEPDKIAWERMFSELCEFKKINGNCLVPIDYSENPALGRWVSKQRIKYKQNILPHEYIKKLNDVGFIWDLRKEQPNYYESFNKGDKCFLFSYFKLTPSFYGNADEKSSLTLYPGVSIVETPINALHFAAGIHAKPNENMALAAYVSRGHNLPGPGLIQACIKIDKDISVDKMDQLFWATIGAFIIVKPIYLQLSGAFIYGDQDYFVCDPVQLSNKSNLSLNSEPGPKPACNDLRFEESDLEAAKLILPRILNILNSQASLPRPLFNLGMFFQAIIWENLNYASSIFSKLISFLDSFAGNPSGKHVEHVSSRVASFLADVPGQENQRKFSKDEIYSRLKYIWELNRYPEVHGHLKLPAEQTNFTKDLFDLFEISRLCVYKMLLLPEGDFSSYSKIPIPSLGLSQSAAKELNKKRDLEAASFFSKTYNNPSGLISFIDFSTTIFKKN